MSLTKRIIDLAKSNLNALLERAAETADPRRRLANIPDVELEAELARRRSARLTEQKVADAKARVDEPAGPAGTKMPADRAERERVAREREARVRSAREARTKAEGAARARSTSSRPGTGSRPGAGTGSRTGGGPGAGGAAPPPRRPASARGKDPELARYYDRLELPYGAEFEEVKLSYRKLMRKYHPDLHSNKTADKQRAATEVAQALTQAYNELEKVLLGGPNRRG